MKQIILSGNLTSEPELKELSENKRVVNFTIANNESRAGVEYYAVKAWNGTADLIKKYFHKGMKIFIAGTFEIEKYGASPEELKQKFVITASSIDFGERKKDEQIKEDVEC